MCAFQYIIVFIERTINGIFVSDNDFLINVSCIFGKPQLRLVKEKKEFIRVPKNYKHKMVAMALKVLLLQPEVPDPEQSVTGH